MKDDCIIVQYSPLDTTVGRYARCDIHDNEFINKFIEECKASDFHCKYIVMFLDRWSISKPSEIREACKETIRRIHK